MVISVQRSQQSSEGKTRIDERGHQGRVVKPIDSSGTRLAEEAPQMVRFGQGDFLIYSRRQIDAEMPAEYEF